VNLNPLSAVRSSESEERWRDQYHDRDAICANLLMDSISFREPAFESRSNVIQNRNRTLFQIASNAAMNVGCSDVRKLFQVGDNAAKSVEFGECVNLHTSERGKKARKLGLPHAGHFGFGGA
jgi:hypothetical protein